MSIDTLGPAGQSHGVRSPLSMRRRITNHVATIFFVASFVVALVPLVWVLSVVIARGWYAVTRSGWWTHSLRGVLPEQFAGGVYHALYGTLVQAGVAAVLAVPLGLMTAVSWWNTVPDRLARVTTFMVDVLAGVPSIVAALFIFSLWIATLEFQQCALAVSLALVLLMLPVVVRSAEEMLGWFPTNCGKPVTRWVSPNGRPSCGSSFPIAMPGIVPGVLLSVARVIGETAPVLVLVGYSRSINFDILHGNMASLPLADLHRTHQSRARRIPARLGSGADADHHRGRDLFDRSRRFRLLINRPTLTAD